VACCEDADFTVMNVTMSSSDTSSEENLDLLREAVDGQFMNDFMFASRGTGDAEKENSGTKKENKIPSLRPHFNKEEQYNELHVTPEFQAFVAKHLVKIIDRQLDEFHGDSTSSLVHNGNTRAQANGGIRLFQSSSRYLSADTIPGYKKAKRRVVHKEDEDELTKCRAAAVSPEWVMSRKEVSCWEKPSGELLILNARGEVTGHKGAKIKIKTNSWGVRNSSFHIDVMCSAHDDSKKRNTETKAGGKIVRKI
jgi:hypothetical protein